MYIAPSFFVYILSAYCYENNLFRLNRLLKITAVVISVFLISLGPFASHLPQLLARLFPFKRGLCHAYWAPNFWALYSLLDRVLILILSKWGISIANVSFLTRFVTLTRGLVGDSEFAVLPAIKPGVTFLLTILSQIVV